MFPQYRAPYFAERTLIPRGGHTRRTDGPPHKS